MPTPWRGSGDPATPPPPTVSSSAPAVTARPGPRPTRATARTRACCSTPTSRTVTRRSTPRSSPPPPVRRCTSSTGCSVTRASSRSASTTPTPPVPPTTSSVCATCSASASPRACVNLADRRLYVLDRDADYGHLEPLIAGPVRTYLIEESWDELLRLAASVRLGAVAPSVMLRKLAAYPRQN